MPDPSVPVRDVMAMIEFSSLPDEARVWLFGISPQLDASATATVTARVNDFISSWKSHGEEIVAASDVIEGAFLAVAVTPQSEASGCSIDRMFGLLGQLESDLGVAIIDSERIFFRGAGGTVRTTSRAEFAKVAVAATPVFDITAERVSSLRSGVWERPAAESWHARLLA